MKQFFNITTPYKFEWNDLRGLFTLLNVILIMSFGIRLAWIGLVISALGIVKDFITDRRLNSIIIHTSNTILNLYFLLNF